ATTAAVSGTVTGTGYVTLTSATTAAVSGTVTGTPYLTLSTNNTAAVSGAVTGSAGVVLATASTGALVTTAGAYSFGSADTFSGGLTINQGTVTESLALGGILASQNLTFAGTSGFTLDNTGASSAQTQALGALAVTAGDATITLNRGAAFNTTLSFTSLGGRTNGGTINFAATGTTPSLGTTELITLTGQATNAFLGAGYFVNGSSYAAINASANVIAATLVATPTAATLGATTSASLLDVTGAITGQTTATVGAIRFSTANGLAFADGNTLQVNGLLKSGASAAAITVATGGTAASLMPIIGTPELVVRTDAATDVLTFGAGVAIINNGAAVSLVKSGAGRLELTSPSTYSGNTFVNQGVLWVNNTATLGTSAGTVTVRPGATLTFSGGNLTVANPISAAGTIGVNGTAAVLKATLSGAVTLEGDTVFRSAGGSNGSFDLTNTVNLGAFNANFNLDGSNTTNVTGVVSGTGSLTKSSTAPVVLSGANTYSGGTFLNGGVLSVGADANLGAATGGLTFNG
ncbi:hypothetical protein EBR16_07405, partial [bacterium]|nr:hypothetical protein [bacterium]